MFAALVFGVYFHFVAKTPDNISHHNVDFDDKIFMATAAILLPAAAVGMVFGWWSWRRFEVPLDGETV